MRVIILVVVRMQCLYLFVHGLGLFAQALSRSVGHSSAYSARAFGIPWVILVIAAVLWSVAPALSRFMLGDQDRSVSVPSLALEDLYRIAFLVLGLYYAMGSLAPTLTWAHYTFAVAASAPGQNLEERRSLYQLFDPVLTLGIGLACILKGRQWARWLAQRDLANEPVAPPEPPPAASVQRLPEHHRPSSQSEPPVDAGGR